MMTNLLLPQCSLLLPRGGNRSVIFASAVSNKKVRPVMMIRPPPLPTVVARGGNRRVIFASAVSNKEVRPVTMIPPRPLPTFVAIVPDGHIAAVERNGKFLKMIEGGSHILSPFFEKIKGVYRIEYPIPDLTEYHVGGTIKLKLIDMARHEELSVMKDTVMAKARTVLEESISELYHLDMGIVDEKFNKFTEEKINQKLAEDPTNNYSMVLNMRYVKKLNPTEIVERVKENMRQEKIMREKREEEMMNVATTVSQVAIALFTIIWGRFLPTGLPNIIALITQYYIARAFRKS